MKKENANYFIGGISLLLLFIVFTGIVLTVDVQSIGPEGSHVGLATINAFMLHLFGTNLTWYHITDLIGAIPIAVAFGFGLLGFLQWIKRKSLKKVDGSLLALGGFYMVIILCYMVFEKLIVNYRPILLEGKLEASYPSSHTMLVIGIMGMAIIQFHNRIKHKGVRLMIESLCLFIIVITVIGRLISGVHWFTDMVAGILLGLGLVFLYKGINVKPIEK